MSHLFKSIIHEFPSIQARPAKNVSERHRHKYCITNDQFAYKKEDYRQLWNRLATLKRNPAAQKRRRQQLSEDDELDIVNQLAQGAKRVDVLKMYGIGLPRLHRILAAQNDAGPRSVASCL